MAAIRFHLDEHIARAIADGLRRRGIDVTTTAGAGLSAALDSEQLAFSRLQGRVLVIHDAGFLRLHQRGHPEMNGSTVANMQADRAEHLGELMRISSAPGKGCEWVGSCPVEASDARAAG